FPTASKSLQRTIAIKYLERDYFPQSWADVDPANYPPNLPVLYPKLASIPTATPEQVFYHALTEVVLGDSPTGLDSFSASDMATDTTTGLPYFKDAWAHPLRFYRWPTLFFRELGQTGPNTVGAFTAADLDAARSMFSTLPVFSGNLAQDLARDPDD